MIQPASGLFSWLSAGRNQIRDLSIETFVPNLKIQFAREFPERVTALTTFANHEGLNSDIFVGTSPAGHLYRFSPDLPPGVTSTIATGLGDVVHFGTCEVGSIAIGDLDHDDKPELLAATSQVEPVGRPRLYVWSLENRPIFLGMARPEIASSWSHGLGILSFPALECSRAFSTFCGYGELVEFQLRKESSTTGFQFEGVSWRTVGQLPASGEQALAADADNDGKQDLCLATGFVPHQAAILIYRVGEQGLDDQPKHRIDEDGRFGNVRFLVGEVSCDGRQDVLAWWCTELSTGDCEIIRYRLGPDGVLDREQVARGDAALLWPRDGQMTMVDLNQDAQPEVWFATGSGNLWRYDRNQEQQLTQAAYLRGEVGPIAAGTTGLDRCPCLYIGCDRLVLEVRQQKHAGKRDKL